MAGISEIRTLRQHPARPPGKRAHEMDGRVVTFPTAPDRLAIDTDLLVGQARQDRRRPGGKGRLESPWIDPSHDIAQGVVRENAVG
jgi:hypothetical protein